MTSLPLKITTRDGEVLAATLYEATESVATPITVVINSGVAIRRRFYDRFATFLCENGFTVITYDYRGIGDSLSGSVSECKATMTDWSTRDFPAVIDAVSDRFPDNTIKLVGHSFGGQILGVTPNHNKIHSMLSVATQSGYWKYWPVPLRYGLAAFWHVVMPASSGVFSYFPARVLKLGENLPAGVARQWARWCCQPDYLRNDVRAIGHDFFADYSGEIRSISFDDDRQAPKPAVDALHAMYSSAIIQREHISSGQNKIGHFGFFRASKNKQMWMQACQWLKAGQQLRADQQSD